MAVVEVTAGVAEAAGRRHVLRSAALPPLMAPPPWLARAYFPRFRSAAECWCSVGRGRDPGCRKLFNGVHRRQIVLVDLIQKRRVHFHQIEHAAVALPCAADAGDDQIELGPQAIESRQQRQSTSVDQLQAHRQPSRLACCNRSANHCRWSASLSRRNSFSR